MAPLAVVRWSLVWLVVSAVGGCGGGGGAGTPGPVGNPEPGKGGARGPGAGSGTGGAAGTAGAGGASSTPGAGGGAAATGGGSGQAPDGGTTGPGGEGGAAPPTNAPLTFDPPSGTFTGMQMVRITAGTPGSVVRYTVDGTLPTRSSPVYKDPLALSGPTIVRAFVEGASADSPVRAAVYLKAADDVAAFTSNLPIVLLHTHGSGAFAVKEHAEDIAGSALVIDPPAGGRAKLVGPATVARRAGLRIRGSSSVMFPQKSYNVELHKGGSDEDEDDSLAGLPAEADWALIAPSRVDRALIRNTLFFALSNEMGRYAPRIRSVEVFVVENGGPVAQSQYMGVYQLMEKVERGKERVNVAKMDATALTEPQVTGGYLFRIDHISRSFPPHFFVGPYPFEFKYPDWDEIKLPARQPQRAYLQGYLQEFFDAIARPDFKNPKTGKPYSEYIDVASFIDYNLLVALSKNVDALKYSFYLHKDLGGKVIAGPLWDFDRTAGTRWDDDYGRRTEEPREWARGDATNPLTWGYWPRLFADPAFKSAHSARWKALAGSTFSVPHLHELVDKLAAELGEAQARHFARWKEMPPSGGSHASEVKILKDWLAARVGWVGTQL